MLFRDGDKFCKNCPYLYSEKLQYFILYTKANNLKYLPIAIGKLFMGYRSGGIRVKALAQMGRIDASYHGLQIGLDAHLKVA